MHQKDRHQLFNPLGLEKCVSVCVSAHIEGVGGWRGGGGQTSPSRLGPFGKGGRAKRQTAAIRAQHWSKGNLDSGNGAICTEAGARIVLILHMKPETCETQ